MHSSLPMSKDVSVLNQEYHLGNIIFPNRLVIQPMEGADGTLDGSPDELAIRRYDRFAKSGAGLIWFEAVAVRHDGRANPRQLWLHEKNADDFKHLVERIRENALKEGNPNPIIIMQATHSGRYSKPDSVFEPMIAYNNPVYEGENPLSPDRIISDDTLKEIEECFSTATKLAMDAGFDGIDIKGCHRYLNSELFAAHTRPGPYGGPLENRLRFFKNAVGNARAASRPGFLVTSRVNIYDGIPYPYGFGVNPESGLEPDMTEPIQMIKAMGFELINITMGNPYFNPKVNRPTDIEGVERMYRLTKIIKDAFPDIALVSSAPTFLREESAYLAAGAVKEGYADMVGFGRMPFAYPEFARDILKDAFDKKQTCITCAKCSELMRGGSKAGCVVRDPVYTELYLELIAGRTE